MEDEKEQLTEDHKTARKELAAVAHGGMLVVRSCN
jgi:hypothetical protein